jgi:hypothetical protein
MRNEYLTRLAKLEARGFSPQAIRAAALKNFETGELPGNPKLARLIQDLRLALVMMEMSVPGPDGAEPTAEALGFAPTPGELTHARQAYQGAAAIQ